MLVLATMVAMDGVQCYINRTYEIKIPTLIPASEGCFFDSISVERRSPK